MKKQIIATTASLIAFAATNAVFAGDIYKWTDADGNVNYGDRPDDGAQPQRMALVSQPTDPARIRAANAARATARTEAAEAAAAAAADGPSPEDLRAEAAEREQKCATYRQQMLTFATSRRLYREDEAGERVYLDEEQTLAARQRVEDQVTEYCSS
jgi:hypothetical protein